MRNILLVSAVLVEACAQGSGIGLAPDDAGAVGNSCISNTDCPEGTCDVASGYCVRTEVEERIVERVCENDAACDDGRPETSDMCREGVCHHTETVVEHAEEVCNGRDDDGDGATDENCPDPHCVVAADRRIFEEIPGQYVYALQIVAMDDGYGVFAETHTRMWSPENPSFNLYYVAYDRDGRRIAEPVDTDLHPLHVSGHYHAAHVAWNGSVFGIALEDEAVRTPHPDGGYLIDIRDRMVIMDRDGNRVVGPVDFSDYGFPRAIPRISVNGDESFLVSYSYHEFVDRAERSWFEVATILPDGMRGGVSVLPECGGRPLLPVLGSDQAICGGSIGLFEDGRFDPLAQFAEDEPPPVAAIAYGDTHTRVLSGRQLAGGGWLATLFDIGPDTLQQFAFELPNRLQFFPASGIMAVTDRYTLIVQDVGGDAIRLYNADHRASSLEFQDVEIPDAPPQNALDAQFVSVAVLESGFMIATEHNTIYSLMPGRCSW